MKIPLNHVQWISRIAIFIVFFWFGLLKILDISPASGLVQSLLGMTLPFIPFKGFLIFLGIWEASIGILFLIPRTTRIAFWLMLVQMFTTFGPLLFLPNETWSTFLLVPTLEGQYIIKNVALLALGLNIYALYTLSLRDKKARRGKIIA